MSDNSTREPELPVVSHVVIALIVATLAALVASTAVEIFPALNAKKNPDFIWFPLPTIAVALGIVVWIEASLPPQPKTDRSPTVWLWVAGAVVVAVLVSLTANGWHQVLAGSVALNGESKFPSGPFQLVYPFLTVAVAGLTEEATVRGLFQLRVRRRIGEVYSQGIAAILFVALHGPWITGLGHLCLLGTIAVLSGLITSRAGSIVPSAVFHSVSNVASLFIIEMLRP